MVGSLGKKINNIKTYKMITAKELKAKQAKEREIWEADTLDRIEKELNNANFSQEYISLAYTLSTEQKEELNKVGYKVDEVDPGNYKPYTKISW